MGQLDDPQPLMQTTLLLVGLRHGVCEADVSAAVEKIVAPSACRVQLLSAPSSSGGFGCMGQALLELSSSEEAELLRASMAKGLKIGGNSVHAVPVGELVDSLVDSQASALDFLPLCFARWVKQHKQAAESCRSAGDAAAAAQHADADPAAARPGHEVRSTSPGAFPPRCQELLHLVRVCSLVATETPLMVLHQYSGRCRLELAFNESNSGCEGPFTATLSLKRSGGWAEQQATIAEASGTAATKKVAKQMAAAAILEALLEGMPLEAFLGPGCVSSGGGGGPGDAPRGALGCEQGRLAVLLGVDRTPGAAAEPLAGLAAFPRCLQLLQLAAASGVAICTPAMLLHTYGQRAGLALQLSDQVTPAEGATSTVLLAGGQAAAPVPLAGIGKGRTLQEARQQAAASLLEQLLQHMPASALLQQPLQQQAPRSRDHHSGSHGTSSSPHSHCLSASLGKQQQSGQGGQHTQLLQLQQLARATSRMPTRSGGSSSRCPQLMKPLQGGDAGPASAGLHSAPPSMMLAAAAAAGRFHQPLAGLAPDSSHSHSIGGLRLPPSSDSSSSNSSMTQQAPASSSPLPWMGLNSPAVSAAMMMQQQPLPPGLPLMHVPYTTAGTSQALAYTLVAGSQAPLLQQELPPHSAMPGPEQQHGQGGGLAQLHSLYAYLTATDAAGFAGNAWMPLPAPAVGAQVAYGQAGQQALAAGLPYSRAGAAAAGSCEGWL